MIRAFFLDFYGTVVHEDGEIVRKITGIIRDTGTGEAHAEIASFWWTDFRRMFLNSYGDSFETQRALEKRSLEHTLERFHSTADAEELSRLMFAHWTRPPIFAESKRFFETSPLPVYIVSNIDTADIREAIAFHGLSPAGVFTSEAARAYKPRPELFALALRETGLRADEALHIGDSVGSDVRGAAALGIRALWLDRLGREAPAGVERITDLTEALERA